MRNPSALIPAFMIVAVLTTGPVSTLPAAPVSSDTPANKPADPPFKLHRDTRGSALAIEPAVAVRAKGQPAVTTAEAEFIATRFLRDHAGELSIPEMKELTPTQTSQDQLGHTRVRYEQRHLGVPVWGGETIVNLDASGAVLFASTNLARELPDDVTPAITAEQARSIASDAATATNSLMSELGVSEAQLWILPARPGAGTNRSEDRIAWRATFGESEESPLAMSYFIDASSGVVISHASLVQHLDRRVYDCSVAPNNTSCYDYFVGLNGYIHGRREGEPIRGPHNNSGLPQFGSTDVDYTFENAGLAIHNWVQASFGLNGANNYGGTRATSDQWGETRYFVHSEGWDGNQDSHCPGGAWLGSSYSIILCHSETLDDVLGHEYAHAIQNWSFRSGGASLGIDFDNEQSRALSESHSDVMGEAFEFSRTGTADWMAGGHTFYAPWRDLVNPHDFVGDLGESYAQRFYDEHFDCTTNPATGGYYANSTVYSHAMYLASEGGEMNGCDIQGQGIEFVKQIYHRAYRNYFVRSQGFSGADTKLLQACGDLYSPAQCAELQKALQAVEANQPGICFDPMGAAGEQAPPCAVNHAGNAATTRDNGYPIATFPVGDEIWLSLTGATANRTLDFQLLPQVASRPIWQATTALAIETADGTVLPDSTLFTMFGVAMTEGSYDVMIDGNRDGHYQPWADTILPITITPAASGVGDGTRPAVTALKAVQPNPTRDGANVAFSLANPTDISLRVYDVAGRLVRTVASESLPAGTHVRAWDGRDDNGLPTKAGLYFVKFVAGSTVDSRKLVRTQ